MNEIIEDPVSEWGEDPTLEEVVDLNDENEAKTNVDSLTETQSARPKTVVSTGSQFRAESQRIRSKQSHPSMFDISARNFKRDPTVELIIETRKSSVIENVYTQLAQITTRSSQNLPLNSFKTHSIPPKTANQVRFSDTVDQLDNNTKSSLSANNTLRFEKDRWDDGLNPEYDKGEFNRCE